MMIFETDLFVEIIKSRICNWLQ